MHFHDRAIGKKAWENEITRKTEILSWILLIGKTMNKHLSPLLSKLGFFDYSSGTHCLIGHIYLIYNTVNAKETRFSAKLHIYLFHKYTCEHTCTPFCATTIVISISWSGDSVPHYPNVSSIISMTIKVVRYAVIIASFYL